MLLTHLFLFVASLWAIQSSGLDARDSQNERVKRERRETTKDLVTWDEHSLSVRGERIMLFSGEFHPFRLPSPGLWLDVFQKIKAMGFSGVSFYTDWGLLEGNPGHVIVDGIFALDDFFQAASEAGIYLIARPGPYINAETAAGGLPGWTLRLKGILRSTASDYLNATRNYVSTIGKIIARAQITNGGPVIIVQPENEYTSWLGVMPFPDAMNRDYMAFVEEQFREAGIIVPFVFNDNLVQGIFAPGSGTGAVDLYGIDAYPMRYDCSHPYVWPNTRFPRDWQKTHQMQSSKTPFAIAEFQGGAGDPWGGVGEDQCAVLVNDQAVRVVYKNNYSFGVTIFNIYMTYGGTNWGNLGYQGGYTSYDYGAAITEDRYVWREKYSETKLEANFLKVSPAYLTATPGNAANGSYVSTDILTVTPLFGNGVETNFYVVRHANFSSTAKTTYKLTVPTSIGKITLPQLGGTLTLDGRDSKIHVTDYDIGGINLIYSTAEVYTWAKGAGSKRVLVLYGAAGETHEMAFPTYLGAPKTSEGSGATISRKGSAWIIQWHVNPTRQVIGVGNLEVHLLWRNEAYNYWVMELPASEPIGNYTSISKSLVIVRAGYLIRAATSLGNELSLTGDINSTTSIEVISAPTSDLTAISFNGERLTTVKSEGGRLSAVVDFEAPSLSIPNLHTQQWKYLDSLPEVEPQYDDSRWTPLTNPSTNVPVPQNLTTPTSLYASDYGYHTGSLIYRGHFFANGNDSTFFVNTTGGAAFAHSIWLNSTFLGSWTGNNSNPTYAQTLKFTTALVKGSPYVLTILIDHMGQDEEAPGTDAIKFPRGILDYSLSGHAATDVTWKMTGNLGGEQYADLARGPRNEGAMFAERQGYHLPNPPCANWKNSNPVQNGISSPGVGFYTTTFDLRIPDGYDIPMSFVFNTTAAARGVNSKGPNYRCQLFVNGYQFGKYVNNLGPQTKFPVPEGILNYNGPNTIALTLWALDPQGAQLGGFELVPQMPVWSGYRKPGLAPMPGWVVREGAY